MPFEPGVEKKIMFNVFDSKIIVLSLEGDLAPYAKIIDPAPNTGRRDVTVLLKYPEYLEPGSHILYLVATEGTTATGTVGGIASVRAGIRVFALYPEQHPVLNGLVTNDLNVDEKALMGLSITNYGEEKIESAIGKITVYDRDNTTVAILETESKSISPFESTVINTVLDSAVYNLSAGIYSINGSFTYDGVSYASTKTGQFRVGRMSVDIIDSTPQVYINSTNKLYITIESEWAGNINDVYAKITTPNGKIIKTPNVDMISAGGAQKAVAQLEAYWETDGLNVGTYDLDISVFYKGESNSKRMKIDLIEGTPPIIEKPKSEINSTLIMIVVSVIVILFILLYFFVFRKNSGKNSTDAIRRVEDNDIKPPSL
jgi:hypothetical protein